MTKPDDGYLPPYLRAEDPAEAEDKRRFEAMRDHLRKHGLDLVHDGPPAEAFRRDTRRRLDGSFFDDE